MTEAEKDELIKQLQGEVRTWREACYALNTEVKQLRGIVMKRTIKEFSIQLKKFIDHQREDAKE